MSEWRPSTFSLVVFLAAWPLWWVAAFIFGNWLLPFPWLVFTAGVWGIGRFMEDCT